MRGTRDEIVKPCRQRAVDATLSDSERTRHGVCRAMGRARGRGVSTAVGSFAFASKRPISSSRWAVVSISTPMRRGRWSGGCLRQWHSTACRAVRSRARCRPSPRTSTSSSATIRHKPRLLSDIGSSYVSGELADWLGDRRMKHVRGAPYHPQTQGKIERWHQTLMNRILLEHYYLPGDLEAQIGALCADPQLGQRRCRNPACDSGKSD